MNTHREDAPRGVEGHPTVWDETRRRPGHAIATAIFTAPCCGFIYNVAIDFSEGAKLSSGQATVLAILLAPIVWWLLMLAQIRGWFGRDAQFRVEE